MSDLLSLRPYFGRLAVAGGWELVTDCETAGPLVEAVRADGHEAALPVRGEPFIAMGEIMIRRTDRCWATFEIPSAQVLEPDYFSSDRRRAELRAMILRAQSHDRRERGPEMGA